MEEIITIKTLKSHNPKIGTREISRLVGISRNTVKRVLRGTADKESEKIEKINKEIEPFTEYIYEGIMVKKLIGSRILEEIRSKGYTGSRATFYRYTETIKKPVKKTYERYETGPGEQAQFDWSPYTVVISGKLTKIYVFSYILGYSRYRVYKVSLNERAESAYEAIEESINDIGGVAQRLQTDNAKCFVIKATKNNIEWNKMYLNLCAHYTFEPSRSLPLHPWSKGKVENPFYYLENHFIKDNKFEDFNDLVKKIKVFQDKVNNKIHETTQTEPIKLLEEEKEQLIKPPCSKYVGIYFQSRKVTADCLISYENSRYSVPHQFACREVWIKASKGYSLEIYSSNNALIATHIISDKKKSVIIDKSHYMTHRVERGNWERLSLTFIELFPTEKWFIDKLKTQKKINPTYHLTQILELTRFYSIENLLYSFNMCLEYNSYSYGFVKGILENNKSMSAIESKISNYSLLLPEYKNIKRPLTEYAVHLNNPTNLKIRG